MKGFGEKKKIKNKQPSKKFSRIPPDQLKAIAFKYHQQGNINEAQKAYQEFINSGLSDPDVFSNFALICQSQGEIDKAINIYKKSIKLFPGHAFSHANLGYLFFQIGMLDDAEVAIRQAIVIQPNLANAYSYLGLVLREKGRLTDAEDITRKAIELQPDLADAYVNLGQILQNQGKLDEAEHTTRKAIELQDDSASIYLNLGGILQDQGDLTEAEANTRKAMHLQADLPDVNLNLSIILKDLGRIEEAVFHVTREIELYPQKQSSYLLLNSLLEESDLSFLPERQSRVLLRGLLKRNDIAHKNLFSAINRLISEETLNKISGIHHDLFDEPSFQHILADDEIISALGLMLFTTMAWEKALINIRKQICLSIQNNVFNKRIFNLTIALAEQCFLNEYIFTCTKQELDAIEQFKLSCLRSDFDLKTLSILACYIPITHLCEQFPSLRGFIDANEKLNNLKIMQLVEPEREHELAASIPKYGSIDDGTSIQVKKQYEEHPYPRWRYASYSRENIQTISSAINNEINPNRVSIILPKQRSRVLIAGCGTGQQIFDALSYSNSDLTAIDLSSSSIAYAKRKAHEYGIEHIRFIEMDILDLPKLNEEFDLIECTGVLHHMKDPSEGLQSLLKILAADGMLKLGFYSELARQDIVEARKIIKSESFEASNGGIRLFRNKLINGEYPNISSISYWPDFYTTSMCRDLCFHIMEHRYSLEMIASLLDQFELRFLGFVLPSIVKKDYGRAYPSDLMQTDLGYWQQYEQANPNTFRQMYQFWTNQR